MGAPPTSLHEAEDAVLDRLLHYVRHIADAVGLRDYTFEVEIAELEPLQLADCACSSDRLHAVVTVCPDYADWGEDDLHRAILHEVLHVPLHPLMAHIHDLEPELGRAHYEALEKVFRRDLERVVDGLTGVLSPLIPRPER